MILFVDEEEVTYYPIVDSNTELSSSDKGSFEKEALPPATEVSVDYIKKKIVRVVFPLLWPLSMTIDQILHLYSQIHFDNNNATLSIGEAIQSEGARFVPAFDLINVVEKIEEVQSFGPSNSASQQHENSQTDNNTSLQNAGQEGRPISN